MSVQLHCILEYGKEEGGGEGREGRRREKVGGGGGGGGGGRAVGRRNEGVEGERTKE